MKREHWVVLAMVAVLLGGCDITVWEVHMRPEGEKLHRRVTIYQVDTGASPVLDKPDKDKNTSDAKEEDLARLRKPHYKQLEGALRGDRATFVGTFGKTMPDDVGNVGSYIRYPTALGTTTVYLERFRGEADQAAVLIRAFAQLDKLTDHLTAWLKSELGSHEKWPALETFMTTGFRRDLKNVFVCSRLSGNVPARNHKKTSETAMMRMVQYLIERDYFSFDDVPHIMQSLSGQGGNEGQAVFACLRRKMVREMGLPPEAADDKAFAFMATGKSVQTSLEKYLATTPEFKALSDEHRKRPEGRLAIKMGDIHVNGRKSELAKTVAEHRIGAADAREPKPLDVLATDVPMTLGPLGGDRDALLLTLKTDAEPLQTNGQWDARTGRVRWERQLPKETEPPEVCFATWVSPDEAAQTKHLGRVALEDEDLLSFCFWRAALTEIEAKEWDAFIASLEPGEALRDKLRTFRFSTDPGDKSGDHPPLRTYQGAKLIEHAIFPAEDKADN